MNEMSPRYLSIPIGGAVMTNERYHAADGISASQLRLLEESPIHLDNRHLFRHESAAMDFGSLVHTLVLEPEACSERYCVTPKFDGRTKEGKAAKEAFAIGNTGKAAVEQDDFMTANRMAENIIAIAGGIFQNGHAEMSYFADDDGIALKCRPDYYIPSLGIAVDLKTIDDISEFGIKKAMANYCYHWSAAFYPKVLNLCGLGCERFIFVFCEKRQPHMVKVREISGEAMQQASLEVDALLNTYRQYRLTGKASVYKTITPFERSAI